MSELYFFQDVPSDASPEWRRLFELMEVDIASPDSLLGRPIDDVRNLRLSQLGYCGITNEFDAILSAVAQKDMGNAYFRQGEVGKAMAMYTTSLIYAPLPSVLSNMAAVMLLQGMYGGAEIYCTRTLSMKECLSDNMIAKAYYRRAVARRLLSHKGDLLRDALADAENASRLAPTNIEIANEVNKLSEMLEMTQPDVMDRIQEQRRAEKPPLTAKIVMMDEDAHQGAKDARMKCAKKYPPTYNYKVEKPPGWQN